jgi:hypothetical protein
MLSQGDKDKDQQLSKQELAGLADAWFDKLDSEKTGQLTPEQLTARLGNILPTSAAPASGSGSIPSPGISFEVLGPVLFSATDTDKDGFLTKAEFKGAFDKWFDTWDTAKAGKLSQEDLRKGLETSLPRTALRNPNVTVRRPTGEGESPAPSPRIRSESLTGSALSTTNLTNTAVSRSDATNSSGRDFAGFKLITDRNIFNASRRARRADTADESRPARVDTITLVGTLDSDKGRFAFFDGSSPEYRKVLSPDQKIASYQITEISGNAVKLQSGTNVIEFTLGMQLRRPEEGEWSVSKGSAPPALSASSVSSSSSNETSSDDDIVKRLMRQREQELK